MTKVILQKGATVISIYETGLRVVHSDGTLGDRLWVIEIKKHERHPEWAGQRATWTAAEMHRIKLDYEAIGYKVMPCGALPVNGMSPEGPEGPLG